MSNALIKSASTVGGMTVISRIFGFIRDMVMAQIFGATAMLDAFTVAFNIPNMIRQLLAEGAFTQAFVPVLAEYQKQKTHDEIQRFVSATSGLLIVTLLAITILGILFSPWVVRIFAPGFTVGSSRFELAVMILRITFSYVIFISLTAFSSAILNTHNRFWAAAFTPTILNIFMIIAAIWFSPYFHISILSLAWGVLFAGIFQVWFQWRFLKPLCLVPRPRIDFYNPGVTKVIKLMLPVLLGVSISQIYLLVDTFFASYLPAGSISWLYYSVRLMDLPLGVFGIAISTVILPHLSRCHAIKADKTFSNILDWALRCVLLAGVPSAIIFAVLSGPILSTLFQHGKFDGHAVMMTRQSLMAFSLGIIPLILIKILITGFYAKQDMRMPVKIGIMALLLNVLFNLMFILPLAHAGIALATSCSALLNMIFLYYFLRKLNIYHPCAGWGLFAFRLFFATALLTIWLLLSTDNTQLWITHKLGWRSLHLFMLLSSALSIYFAGLWLVGMRPNAILLSKQINFEYII